QDKDGSWPAIYPRTHKPFTSLHGVSRKFKGTSGWIERRRGLGRSHAVPIESGEIDRLKHQRRETPVSGRGGDDFSGERKQQAWALDHDYRLKAFRRHAENSEDSSIE